MPRKSVINRNIKRVKKHKRHAAKRAEMKAQVINPELSITERMEWHQKLQKLSRDSSKTRQRNRCRITGRGNGVFSKFGLCRIKLREYAMNGEITGLVKSSW